ncbi:MAG: hypothetical protein U5K72_01720 [Balneolaceae bacterium]|nr:hypothetical protein [Balneolaceae bacterium]
MALPYIAIHYPGFGQGLISVVVNAFKQQTPKYKKNRHGGLTGMAVVPGYYSSLR